MLTMKCSWDNSAGIVSAGIVLTMKCSWDKERWYCADDEMFMG